MEIPALPQPLSEVPPLHSGLLCLDGSLVGLLLGVCFLLRAFTRITTYSWLLNEQDPHLFLPPGTALGIV